MDYPYSVQVFTNKRNQLLYNNQTLCLLIDTLHQIFRNKVC